MEERVPQAVEAVRVMVVDDHPVIRFGLEQILNSETDITVVGDAGDIDSMLKAVVAARPDIVILDLDLGAADGIHALERLSETAPDVRVLIYTAHDDETHILPAAEMGMHGYLLKGCPTEELISAVRAVHAGGTVIDPGVASLLMKRMSRRGQAEEDKRSKNVLSEREIEVLGYLAKGKSNRAIADMLFISEATVKFHVHAILSKLKVSNRTRAVTTGMQMGLINLESNS